MVQDPTVQDPCDPKNRGCANRQVFPFQYICDLKQLRLARPKHYIHVWYREYKQYTYVRYPGYRTIAMSGIKDTQCSSLIKNIYGWQCETVWFENNNFNENSFMSTIFITPSQTFDPKCSAPNYLFFVDGSCPIP